MQQYDLSTQLQLLNLQARYAVQGEKPLRKQRKQQQNKNDDNKTKRCPTLNIPVGNNDDENTKLAISFNFLDDSPNDVLDQMQNEALGKYDGCMLHPNYSHNSSSFAFTTTQRLMNDTSSLSPRHYEEQQQHRRQHYFPDITKRKKVMNDMKQRQRQLEIRPNLHSPRQTLPQVPNIDVGGGGAGTTNSLKHIPEMWKRSTHGSSVFESQVPRETTDFNMKSLLKLRFDPYADFVVSAIPAPVPPEPPAPGPGHYDTTRSEFSQGHIQSPTFSGIRYNDMMMEKHIEHEPGPGAYYTIRSQRALSHHVPSVYIKSKEHYIKREHHADVGPGHYYNINNDNIIGNHNRGYTHMFHINTNNSRLVDNTKTKFDVMHRIGECVKRVTMNDKNHHGRRRHQNHIHVRTQKEMCEYRRRVSEIEHTRGERARQKAKEYQEKRVQTKRSIGKRRVENIKLVELKRPQLIWVQLNAVKSLANRISGAIRNAYRANRLYILRVNIAARYIQRTFRMHRMHRRRVALRLVLGKFIPKFLMNRRIRKKRRQAAIIFRFFEQFPPRKNDDRHHHHAGDVRLETVIHTYYTRVITIQQAWRNCARVLHARQRGLIKVFDKFVQLKHKQAIHKENNNRKKQQQDQQQLQPNILEIITDEVKMQQIAPILHNIKKMFIQKKHDYQRMFDSYMNDPQRQHAITQEQALYEFCGRGNSNLKEELAENFKRIHPPPFLSMYMYMNNETLLTTLLNNCCKQQAQLNSRKWRNADHFRVITDTSSKNSQEKKQLMLQRKLRAQQRKTAKRILNNIVKLFTTTKSLERLNRYELRNLLVQLLPVFEYVNINIPISASLSTCLHSAAWFRQYDLCRWLIAFGADVNIKNLRGNTPTHLLCENIHKPDAILVLALFMLAGCDLYARNSSDSLTRPIDVIPSEYKCNITKAMVKERYLELPSYKTENFRQQWRDILLTEWKQEEEDLIAAEEEQQQQQQQQQQSFDIHLSSWSDGSSLISSG